MRSALRHTIAGLLRGGCPRKHDDLLEVKQVESFGSIYEFVFVLNLVLDAERPFPWLRMQGVGDDDLGDLVPTKGKGFYRGLPEVERRVHGGV